ncbi:hypothetical protein AVEN_173927-1 [Araneus ventricosus]|uniref:Uncharacterized protein n=1 Tax=Araneus ventricosus TaxID=182803 RepID=A0A4Y2PJ51_ARAVE|nr:hypothetical protein AVEN_173927-1 [Araneus ventricosus]
MVYWRGFSFQSERHHNESEKYDTSPKFSIDIATFHFEEHEGYFGTDIKILNCGLIDRPSPTFRTTPPGGRLVTTYDLTCGIYQSNRVSNLEPRPYH